MQTKLHIKKGDIVRVIAGNDRGTEAKVLMVDRKKNRALVEGVGMVSKHTKPNAANPQGGIIKKEASVHISNLMVVDAKGNATRTGRKTGDKDKLVRYSKKTGEVIK
jgi:large subunit ribosomal protein L24